MSSPPKFWQDPTKASKKMLYHTRDNINLKIDKRRDACRTNNAILLERIAALEDMFHMIEHEVDLLNQNIGVMFGAAWTQKDAPSPIDSGGTPRRK